MDVLSHILRVPGIAKRRQQQSEPEGEAQSALPIETRNLFTALRQKLLSLVGK